MPDFNFIAIGIASLIPLLVGAVWYLPGVMGDTLSTENGVNPETKKKHSTATYVVTVIAGFLISMLIAAIMSTHAKSDITLAHGMFHGGVASLFMAIPPFLVIALFESKSLKYIIIHAIYWLISMVLMGGIIGFMS